jgi:hypothetical protein
VWGSEFTFKSRFTTGGFNTKIGLLVAGQTLGDDSVGFDLRPTTTFFSMAVPDRA